MQHVRDIISELSYSDLVAKGIIPNILPAFAGITSGPGRKYPPFVYASKSVSKFSFFGMFMELMVRRGFRAMPNVNVDVGTEPAATQIPNLNTGLETALAALTAYEAENTTLSSSIFPALRLTEVLYDETVFSQDAIKGYIPTLTNIIKELAEAWQAQVGVLGTQLRYNVEVNVGQMTAHPDILTNTTVLDVKNTCSFGKMAEESILQVLAYYTLCKYDMPTLQNVGFVLPQQRTITVVSLGAWDTTAFEAKLAQTALVQSETQSLREQFGMGDVFSTAGQDLNGMFAGPGILMFGDAPTQMFAVGGTGGQITFGGTNRLTDMQVIIAEISGVMQHAFNRDAGTRTGPNFPPRGFIPSPSIPLPPSGLIPVIVRPPAVTSPFLPVTVPVAINPQTIGAHIPKGKSLVKTFTDWSAARPGAPCQLFLRNPRGGKMAASTPAQVPAAAALIAAKRLMMFCHTIYTINLCTNVVDEKGDYWMQRYLNEDVAMTVALGGRGTVVHTGARKTIPLDTALNTMENMVRTALTHATPIAPLLLETPCGEGTEVCAKIEELAAFCARFNPAEQTRLGICVDTCHVFAAGYDPLAYLNHWEQYMGTTVPVKLVHFNDSATSACSHTDRHAAPGTGHIGMAKMEAVADYCRKKNIPMVTE